MSHPFRDPGAGLLQHLVITVMRKCNLIETNTVYVGFTGIDRIFSLGRGDSKDHPPPPSNSNQHQCVLESLTQLHSPPPPPTTPFNTSVCWNHGITGSYDILIFLGGGVGREFKYYTPPPPNPTPTNKGTEYRQIGLPMFRKGCG